MNKNSNNPLAEVFGFPSGNLSDKAQHYRENRLCPFNNHCPNCTKDKADDPLGICSVNFENRAIITCPTRFREDWIILKNAADFFWKKGTKWASLPEIRLLDADGQSTGNIDYVIVSYDKNGHIIDFASIEVQGVYISGNLRNPFQKYMENPTPDFHWEGHNYPRPDYLSSSRKRLIPQMMYKGGIFKAWNKKQCVAIQKSFFQSLPELPQTTKDKADIAWFLYNLVFSKTDNAYHLQLVDTVYTEFHSALQKVIFAKQGHIEDFMSLLQGKFDECISNAPETHSIFELL